MATILVTDGDQRAALAITRSLGRAGHRVVVAAARTPCLAGGSRWCEREVRLPDPLTAPGAYMDGLARTAREEAADVVLPVTEPALLAVLPATDALDGAAVPFPDLETFRRASDKAWVTRAAERAGLRAPRQEVVAAPSEAEALAGPGGRAAVLKPARSVQGGRKVGVSYVGPGESVAEAVARLPPEAFPVLVQERIVGPGVGVFLLRWEGRTVASFAHRRLREKPPSGGVSVLRESVPLDPSLLATAEAVLDELGWRGVAMVELKIDEATGEPVVMEINGRFWGSLQLAVDAGVDFPALLVDLALGRDPSPVVDYRTGVRTRWLMGDVDHLLLRLRRSPERLDLPPGAPGRIGVIRDFVRGFLPPNREEVLRLSDPGPFRRELREWFRGLRPG